MQLLRVTFICLIIGHKFQLWNHPVVNATEDCLPIDL